MSEALAAIDGNIMMGKFMLRFVFYAVIFLPYNLVFTMIFGNGLPLWQVALILLVPVVVTCTILESLIVKLSKKVWNKLCKDGKQHDRTNKEN